MYAFLIEHADGPVLIDTSVGLGNDFIDELYSPVHLDLDAALAKYGLAVDGIATVITLSLLTTHASGRLCSGPSSTSDRMPRIVRVMGAQITDASTSIAASRDDNGSSVRVEAEASKGIVVSPGR